ncbi:LeoA/HP0731 family dynamin-like GTPase [Treponema phagedenis]|uniref:LeoA/HP0731 family dynamin-like GTPase n=1 Tax=Treponema phagedenis TaxID=162 RepID=UPI0011E7131A|nr:labile enterotoxin output A [Treponema phagedenis]QEK05511.1 labile enterotoxin output A [Treponema phagedenis]
MQSWWKLLLSENNRRNFMNTMSKFTENQEKAVQILKTLNEFLQFGKNKLGAAIEAALLKKIEHAISDVQSEKLKVALIGGFSEGKTSIAAAWLDKLDKSSMNISERESSNEVKIYELPDDKITLIDTPGLFGFREQTNPDTMQVEKYKDITKKYVSEAHIILYVMNSVNPIKASHDEELRWLFRDLNLLPRTIFVLSRFDEVADIEDESEYQNNLKIKKENIMSRLSEAIGLNVEEKNEFIAVAVSANPFGEGIEYWFSRSDEYRKLSHIDSLKEATTEIIERNGSMPAIIYEAQKSVISDVISKQLPIIKEQNDKLNTEMKIISNAKKRYGEDLNNLQGTIRQAKSNLRDFFTSYFSGLISQVNGTSIETFQDFFIMEIGNEGAIINSRIKEAIENETQSVDFKISQTQNLVATEVSHYNSAVGDLFVQGVKTVTQNLKITNTTVKGARDLLKLPIKFKPWQAVKIAGGVMKALPLIGVALDAFSLWSEAKDKDKFQKAKTEVANNLAVQQSEWLSLLDSDDFIKLFFPHYMELVSNQNEIDKKIQEQAEYSKNVEAWYNQGISIANKFKEL